MKSSRTTRALLATAVLAGSLGQASAAWAADGTATASATIVQAIAITKTADLKFGQIVASSSSGTVTVSPAGVRSFSGGATNGGTSGPTTTSVSAASFDVTGYSNTAFTITLPSTVTLNRSGGGGTMTVSNFLSSPTSPTALVTGARTVTVGADLAVGASQATGDYSNTFTVTVDYQ